MKRLITLLFAGLSLTAYAQETPEVQVIATKVQVPEEHIGDDVEVVKLKELETFSLTGVKDVLSVLPGVHISESGEFGKQTSIYSLGLDSRYILFLLDGMPVNDPSTPDGAGNIEWIDPEGFDRIEFLKGAQSALYGSEAIGATLNLVPEEPRKNATYLKFKAGKYRTFSQTLKTSRVFAGGYTCITIKNFKTLGFSATNEKAGMSHNPDEDPFQYTYGLFNIGYKPSEDVKLKVLLLVKGGYTEYDEGKTDYDGLFTGLTAELVQGENTVWEVKLSNNKELRRDTFGRYEGITRFVSVSPTYYVSESSFLKLGLSLRQNTADTTAYPSVSNKRQLTRSTFAEVHIEHRNLFLTGTARADSHSTYHTHTTYKLSCAYSLKGLGTTLKAQYGTGFKLPTLSQLYGYYSGPWGKTLGNSKLKPEKSEGWSAGLSQKLPLLKASLGARYFKNRVWNIVSSYYDANLSATTYRNENKAVTEGAEFSVTASIGKGVGIFANYTHLRAVCTEGSRWKKMERRPKNSYNIGFNAENRKLQATLWLQHYGSREDTDWSAYPNPKKVKLSAFTTLNCSVSCRLNSKATLAMKLLNITDRDYSLAYGYNTMGRAGFLELTFKL